MKPRKLSTIPKKDKDAPSVTDKINMDDELIKERLDKYVETPIDKINVSSHVRYFIFDKKQAKYMLRLGGILTKKDKDFVILSNGELTWSVSLVVVHEDIPYPTKFWRILTNEQYQEKKHGEKAKELQKQNEELRLMLENFKKEMDTKRLAEPIPVAKIEPIETPSNIEDKQKKPRKPRAKKETVETPLNTPEITTIIEEVSKDLKETEKKPRKPRAKKEPVETPTETPTVTVVKQRKPRIKKCIVEISD